MLTNSGPDGQLAASSFKHIPARTSILSAREIPSAGGDTAFCSSRAAWEAMPEVMKTTAINRIAIHDFGWSRSRVAPSLITEAERSGHPPVERAVVAMENPRGPALYLGQHARSLKGLNELDSRTLVDSLMAFATNPDFVYSHCWHLEDVVVWDNWTVIHRATPFASATERRYVVRTTASCPRTVR